MPTCHSIELAPALLSILKGFKAVLKNTERAVEFDNLQSTALHILCANPHVNGDTIRAYLQLAPESADQ